MTSGVQAEFSCNRCRLTGRICIVSSLSRRCAECLLLNRGCSSSYLQPRSAAILRREIELRNELDRLIHRVLRCLALLDSLSSAREVVIDSVGE